MCTIGNGARFDSVPRQQRYKLSVPASYVSNMEETLKPKMKMGVIGTTMRFKTINRPSPGPGEYNIQAFKSLSKGELSILGGGTTNAFNTTSSPR